MRPGTYSTSRSAELRLVSWAAGFLLGLVFFAQRGYGQQTVVGPATVSSGSSAYAGTTITNAGSFVINGSASVTFTASNSINLEPGFHAIAGTASMFHATIGISTQSITFPAISAQTAGTSLALSASASSGLPVTFSSSTTGVCSVSGATVSFNTAGTCTIVAYQLGNSTYSAATSVQETFAVSASLPATTTAKDYIYVNGRVAVIENH